MECKKCGLEKTMKQGRTISCGPCTSAYRAGWRKKNHERLKAEKRKWNAEHKDHKDQQEKNRRIELRMKLLKRYGASCSCCGESKPEVLCIDHIEGGGEKHRKEVGSGTAFQWWLLRNGLPDGFRTLCHNCNYCTFAYGRCVHEGPPTKTGGSRYEYMKEYRLKIRKLIFFHYGTECAACGVSQFEFLCLDHINGGGKKHQREVGRGSAFYKWVLESNFPTGFQVLCQNCNFAKG